MITVATESSPERSTHHSCSLRKRQLVKSTPSRASSKISTAARRATGASNGKLIRIVLATDTKALKRQQCFLCPKSNFKNEPIQWNSPPKFSFTVIEIFTCFRHQRSSRKYLHQIFTLISELIFRPRPEPFGDTYRLSVQPFTASHPLWPFIHSLHPITRESQR